MFKKGFLLVVLLLILTACGGSKDDTDSNDDSAASDIQISVISTSVTQNENRVVIALWDGENRVADAKSIYVIARDTLAEDRPIVWEGHAQNFSDYEIPYWVVYPKFPHSGAWVMEGAIELASGKAVEGTIPVNVYDAPKGVAPGVPAVPSENRTWTGEADGDIHAITSATEPNPAYYSKTIAQALTEDKPLVVIFSTPGLCQSKICTPVMNTIDALWADYQDKMNFIHIEVYADFETLEWTREMNIWGLQSEPWIYVINADGIVHTRLEGPVAVSELEPILAGLVGE